MRFVSQKPWQSVFLLLPLASCVVAILVVAVTEWLPFLHAPIRPINTRYIAPGPPIPFLTENPLEQPDADLASSQPAERRKARNKEEVRLQSVFYNSQGAEFVWRNYRYLHACLCIGVSLVGLVVLFRYLLEADRAVSAHARRLLTLQYILGMIATSVVVLAASWAIPRGQFFYGGAKAWLEQISVVSGLTYVPPAVLLMHRLTITAGLFCTLAFGSTLITSPVVGSRTQHIAAQMGLARLLLYLGTLLLISAVVHLTLAFTWSLAYLYPKETPLYKSADAYTHSLVAGHGIQYTLLLAAAYLPTTAILSLRAWQARPSEVRSLPLPEQEDWLKKQGLMASPLELVARFAALLGPLLAGSLSDILKQLSPK